ncbi:MAG TPA: LysR family transcriptional regulator [Roseiarcus sp.]|nr:LysR family transcriptional regulator [Roseiarcus sp.]
MDKLSAMNAFAKVVALGSFAEAARALGSTRSAASKAVMELEHVLGVRLLDRTTRRVRTTEAGLAITSAASTFSRASKRRKCRWRACTANRQGFSS